jgi:hypothetical protein
MKTATSILRIILLSVPMAFAAPAPLASGSDVAGDDMVRHAITTRDGRSITLSLHNSLVTGPKHNRRYDFPANPTLAFNGDNCGDSTFDSSEPPADFPNIDDCKDIVAGLNGMDRHWELNNGGVSGVPDWVKLVESGTCGFYIYRRWFPDITTTGTVVVGTQDAADLIQTSLDRYSSYSTVSWGSGSIQVSHLIPTHGTMSVTFLVLNDLYFMNRVR